MTLPQFSRASEETSKISFQRLVVFATCKELSWKYRGL